MNTEKCLRLYDLSLYTQCDCPYNAILGLVNYLKKENIAFYSTPPLFLCFRAGTIIISRFFSFLFSIPYGDSTEESNKKNPVSAEKRLCRLRLYTDKGNKNHIEKIDDMK